MQTGHKVILANTQQTSELADSSIQLIVSSPPYPMIKMWDAHFATINPQIATLQQELETKGGEASVTQIYDAMHEILAETWREAYRVLIEGGIACINMGDAARTVNNKFSLFPNHSRIIEHCEKAGSPPCLISSERSQPQTEI
jgi:DNA modification methylase